MAGRSTSRRARSAGPASGSPSRAPTRPRRAPRSSMARGRARPPGKARLLPGGAPALERLLDEGEAILPPEEQVTHQEARRPAEAEPRGLVRRLLEARLDRVGLRAHDERRAVEA